MERSVGSGGVLKKKSSSGCLIIKKKGVDNNSSGLGGLSDNSKDKKRARVLASSSSSSDEDESLELMRRKVNEKRLHNGSMGNTGRDVENRDNVGIEIGGERKRSRLDLFEFDEYDEFDGKKMRNEHLENRFKAFGQSGSGNLKECGVGSSNRNLVVDKRRHGSYIDGSSSGVRNKGLEFEDDEVHMPISMLRLKCQQNGDKPIRLQGKNGVLKVMVNKRKKMDFPSQPKSYDSRDLNERESSRSDDSAKDLLVRSPSYPTIKPPENQLPLTDRDKSVGKVKKEKRSEKSKPLLDKGSKIRDSEVEATDPAVLKMAPPSGKASAARKVMKKEGQARSPAPENFISFKGSEGKAKRGGSTEKQMLREKIRGMLLEAGWTIDYRPRRNREYLDAVYINPSGTAYWSIIKAYDALKKQLEEDNGKSDADDASPSFAPLSEDLINKLTRQTKKKIEEDMKRKRKDDGVTKSAKRPAIKQAADSSDSDENEEHVSSCMKQNYKSRSGKFAKMDQDSDDDSPKRNPRKVRIGKPSTVSKSNIIPGRTSKVIGRCTLLVRSSDQGNYMDSDGYVPYRGKRTVLAWLINSGTAQLSEKVQYMNRKRTRVLLEGWITRDGIHCGCCSKILTVSKFELHAGSKLRQPFQNIFLESGSSLLQCQVDAWNGQDDSICRDIYTVDVDGDDPDDDTCGICGDGGDLICCDSCPSTFHQICLEIQDLPKGDWHCPNCMCKFCGHAEGNTLEETDSAGNELSRCSFCEKKYHKACSENEHPLSNGASFCGLKCQEIYEHLQKNLGVKHELDAGYSWSLIQRTDLSDASQRGFAQRVECNSKLAVALSIMDECFLPIIDRRSGINIVHNVVYNCGSNFNRLNFHGFYTVILERGDEIICAASIRLHGTRLAEMPFIGTREMYRRQGMCRRLLSAIETELRSLKIQQLIIPAISEHTNTWTTVFGFNKLEDVHKKEIKSLNMLVFPGTDMLQKQLAKHGNSGAKFSKSTKSQPQLVENSKMDSSLEQINESKIDAPDFASNEDKSVPDSDSISQGTSNSNVKTEVENEQSEQNESSARPESINNSNPEQQILDSPAVANSCKIEVEPVNDPSVNPLDADDSNFESSKPADSQVNVDCAVNEEIVNNGCMKPSEISAANDEVSWKPNCDSQQSLNSELDPSTKPSSDSAVVNADQCNGTAKENISDDCNPDPANNGEHNGHGKVSSLWNDGVRD